MFLAIWLYICAFLGNEAAASDLMLFYEVPVALQNFLTQNQNVRVQSSIARYTHELSKVVFHFRSLADMERFKGLCPEVRVNRHSVSYKARVLTMGPTRIYTFPF